MMMKQPASSAFLRIVALCLILLSSSSTRTAVRAFTQPTRIAATATVNSQSSSSSSSSCCTTIPAKPSIAGTQRASSISTADPAATTATTTGVAPWERVRGSVSSAASNMNALRKRIAKQGIVTALSYSLVSNAFTSVFLGAAWYGFSVQVRTVGVR